MSKGYISFVLHAHLPFVRHPEHERFLEENWLYEAISETYLPLLRVFNALNDEGIPYRLTMSLSPTLLTMLTDELLQDRYISYCERSLDLSEREISRTKNDDNFQPLAIAYRNLIQQNLDDFAGFYKKNITKGFRALEKEGHLELITTAATHSFLPLYQEYPNNVDMQIQTAVLTHGRIMRKNPSGFWLPECGFYPGLERHIRANSLRYFLTSAHGLLFADNPSPYGVYAPLMCPNGIAAFGRDIPSSQAVWSSEDGYPGDFSYRDFYRDIGFDLPLDYIGPYIIDGDIRINTGLKYYAITGKTDKKRLYSFQEASNKAKEHAANFLYNRIKQIDKLEKLMDRPPVIMCPYDAELFGHWWFEGPQWLDFLIRMIHNEGNGISMITPSEYLAKHPQNQIGVPSFSSWGNNGYAEVWLDGSNDWIYRHVHKAIERMGELVQRFPNAKGLKQRALNQAAREVLLSQASDWSFIMKTGTTVPYAVQRVKEHISNFNVIYDGLTKNVVETEWLTRTEKRNNIFQDIDYRLYKRDLQPEANSSNSSLLTSSR